MRAVRSEWTKLRTVPSTGWLLLAIVGCTVVATAATVASVSTTHCPTPAECFEDTTKLSLTGVWLGQAAVVALAVLAITSEYGTRTIQTTLAANPHRLGVLATKAAVVVGLVLPAGAVGVPSALSTTSRARTPTTPSISTSPAFLRSGWRCSASTCGLSAPPPRTSSSTSSGT